MQISLCGDSSIREKSSPLLMCIRLGDKLRYAENPPQTDLATAAFILDFTDFYDTGGKDPPEKFSE